MNPKSINDLDPKLKETYERVMGTSLGVKPTTPTVPVMKTEPSVQPESQIIPQPAPEQSPETQLKVETPIASTNDGTTVSQVFRADNQSKDTEPATVSSPSFKKASTTKIGSNKLFPIIVIGAVLFLAAYAVIWAKLLGLF